MGTNDQGCQSVNVLAGRSTEYKALRKLPCVTSQRVNAAQTTDNHAQACRDETPAWVWNQHFNQNQAYSNDMTEYKSSFERFSATATSVPSDNIVFFFLGSLEIPWSSPIISGYDYARMEGGKTEFVFNYSDHDIYRHPKTNGTIYEKSYDIYSLGIVLMEVAYWQPNKQIVNLAPEDEETLDVLAKIKDSIVHLNRKKDLSARVGDTYVYAVSSCLGGFSGHEGEKGTGLQKWFQDKVVTKLGDIKG
ncbi:hypothetical protein BDV06DRAFT_221576 [Aspergillus oleicola]